MKDPACEYPPTRRVEHVDTYHGVEVADPFKWLEDIDSDETRAWIKAQNDLSLRFLHTTPGYAKLKERLTRLWNYEKFDPPEKKGGKYFYCHNNGLQNQSVLYVLDALEGRPRVLLDPNNLSADGTEALTGFAVSEDGRLVAYSISGAGSDWQAWRVRETDSGRDRPDLIRWSKFSGAAWTRDAKGFFYSGYDPPSPGQEFKEANFFQKLFYHRVGTSQEQDLVVYERSDQREWGFSAIVTEDGCYLVINVWKGTQRENALFYKDLSDPKGEVVELLNAWDASYGFIGNVDSMFYMLTDLDAPMKRVICIDIHSPEPKNCVEIIPEAPEVLEAAVCAGDRIVALHLKHAQSVLRVFDLNGGFQQEVPLPSIGTVTGLKGQGSDSETFIRFESFTVPPRIFRYDVKTHEETVFRQPEVGFDPDDYETIQFFYPGRDGTRIPIFISRKKGLDRTQPSPALLTGYGGFDISMTPSFSVGPIVWMDLGGIFAMACVRGGGEYGKPWHEAGRKLKKQTVFDDFIAGAEWLIGEGLTSREKLAIAGGSNGGLLVGACMTQRPDLFGACIPSVGVMDMLRFHQFTIGWAWVSDYGTPDVPEEFNALLAYSPYHNLKKGVSYPATLVMTGDHDDRVFPAHSFKFAAMLQACHEGDAPVLLRVDTKAGHGAGKPTSKLIEEGADRWAFLVRVLGLDVPF